MLRVFISTNGKLKAKQSYLTQCISSHLLKALHVFTKFLQKGFITSNVQNLLRVLIFLSEEVVLQENFKFTSKLAWQHNLHLASC